MCARDRMIKAAWREDGVAANSQLAALWHEPWNLKTGGGVPCRVFTPFWRKLAADLPPPQIEPPPTRIKGLAQKPSGLTLAALDLLPKLGWDAGFYPRWRPRSEEHTSELQ